MNTLLSTEIKLCKKLTLIFIEAVQIFYNKLDNTRNYYVIHTVITNQLKYINP